MRPKFHRRYPTDFSVTPASPRMSPVRRHPPRPQLETGGLDPPSDRDREHSAVGRKAAGQDARWESEPVSEPTPRHVPYCDLSRLIPEILPQLPAGDTSEAPSIR